MTGGGGPLAGMVKQRAKRFEKQEEVDVTFQDVAGLASAKRDLQEIVDFLRHPRTFRTIGRKAAARRIAGGRAGYRKDALGPCGCWRGRRAVLFHHRQRVHRAVRRGWVRPGCATLFEQAKEAAPAIIFIDEIDAVGRSRGTGLGGGHDEREQTPQPVAFRNGRLRSSRPNGRDGGHQPPGCARSSLATPGTIRPAHRGRPAGKCLHGRRFWRCTRATSHSPTTCRSKISLRTHQDSRAPTWPISRTKRRCTPFAEEPCTSRRRTSPRRRTKSSSATRARLASRRTKSSAWRFTKRGTPWLRTSRRAPSRCDV